MTKSEALLAGLHQLIRMAENEEEQSREASKFFNEVLQDINDKAAIEVLAQALTIEAATLIEVLRDKSNN